MDEEIRLDEAKPVTSDEVFLQTATSAELKELNRLMFVHKKAGRDLQDCLDRVLERIGAPYSWALDEVTGRAINPNEKR